MNTKRTSGLDWWAFLVTLGAALLVLAMAGRAHGGDITPGYTWANGEQVTASKMNAFLTAASVNSTFYTSRSSLLAPLGTENILVYDSSAAVFRKISITTLLTRTNLITDLLPAVSLNTNDLFMVVSGGALSSTSLTNLAAQLTPWVNVGALNGLTNLSQLSSAQAGNSNQVFFLAWTNGNGTARAMSFSNLLSSGVPDLGTNKLLPYTFAQVFTPSTVYLTNNATNIWGFTNVVPITNLYFGTNTLPFTNNGNYVALTNSDTVPIRSTLQGTNTTATLGSLVQFFTNAVPQYRQASFTNIPFTMTETVKQIVVTNHGLGIKPTLVNISLYCISSNLGYVPGDSIPWSAPKDIGNQGPIFTWAWDATNISVFNYHDGEIITRTNMASGYQTPDTNAWRMRIDAEYLP